MAPMFDKDYVLKTVEERDVHFVRGGVDFYSDYFHADKTGTSMDVDVIGN